ncbi:tetratricopeptide repeat protein [bacterium]|nr:tetratricopeptide repeat protein [bacterium]
MKTLFTVTLFTVSLLLAGCATRDDVNRFKMQLDYLEASNASLEQQLNQLDSLVRIQNKLIRSMHAEQLNYLVLLQEEIQMVEGILRESGHQVSSLSGKIENIREDIIRNKRALVDSTLPDSLRDTSNYMDTPNADQVYKTAEMDLAKGNYKLAMVGFNQYLNLLPDGEKADDSQYQIGECLFSQKKYSEAIPEYLKVEAQYPNSEYIPTSLFKIGLCYLEMDNKQMAKKFFNAIVKSHGLSDEATLAKEKLKEL